MEVTWNQFRRLLDIDETFAQTGGDYESYTIHPRYLVTIKHSDLDGEWYTIDNYVQLINTDEGDVVCVIQLEGQREDPVSFLIADGTIEVDIYARCTPPMMLAP